MQRRRRIAIALAAALAVGACGDGPRQPRTPTEAFARALRAELPRADITTDEADVVVVIDGKRGRIRAERLERECPEGPGADCSARMRAIAHAIAHDFGVPPTCTGALPEPALRSDDANDTTVTTPLVGHLKVGVATYREQGALRVWCTSAEVGIPPERLLAWATDRVRTMPPPPVAPLAEHKGIWTVIARTNTSLYMLDPARLVASLGVELRAPLVAVVPNEHEIVLTTKDRPDLVKELRKVAAAHSAKAGPASRLTNEVYELSRTDGWRLLPE